MRAIYNIFVNIYKACAVIGAICIFLSMILGMIVIVARSIFNYSIPGHYEITKLFLAVIVYFTISYTQYCKGNVSIGLFISKIGGTKRLYIDILNLSLCLIVCAFLFWGTSQEAVKAMIIKDFQMGIYNFPLWPSKLGVSIGFLFLLTCLIIQILEKIKELRSSSKDNVHLTGVPED